MIAIHDLCETLGHEYEYRHYASLVSVNCVVCGLSHIHSIRGKRWLRALDISLEDAVYVDEKRVPTVVVNAALETRRRSQ